MRPILISPLAGTFTDRPTFQWQAVPAASSYQLTIRSGSGDQLIQNIPSNSYTPPAALPSGPIQWWVRATGAPQNGGWSYSGHLNRKPRATVTGPASPASTTAKITWTIVPGTGRYVLHVENTAAPGVAVIREDNVTATDFTPSTPLAAGTYRAWIKAIDATSNAFGSGLWSRPFDFTVAAVDSPRPQNLLNSGPETILASLPERLLPGMSSKSNDASQELTDDQRTTASIDSTRSLDATLAAADAMANSGVIDTLPVLEPMFSGTLKALDTVMGQQLLFTMMLE